MSGNFGGGGGGGSFFGGLGNSFKGLGGVLGIGGGLKKSQNVIFLDKFREKREKNQQNDEFNDEFRIAV